MQGFQKIFCALAAASAALALPTAAQAQGQAQPQVVTQFDDATISRLLLDVQTTWRIEPGADGVNVYRVSSREGGLNFTLTPRACSAEQGCVGLLMLTPFTLPEGLNIGQLDQFLHAYNDANPNGKAYRAGSNTVILQGYVNSVYGISYANAQAQLLVFGQEIQKLRGGLTELTAPAR